MPNTKPEASKNEQVIQIGDVFVELFYSAGSSDKPPHMWEAYKEDTTNEDGYFTTGGLWWEGRKLTDYDGVFELPLPVKEALKSLGYSISECE